MYSFLNSVELEVFWKVCRFSKAHHNATRRRLEGPDVQTTKKLPEEESFVMDQQGGFARFSRLRLLAAVQPLFLLSHVHFQLTVVDRIWHPYSKAVPLQL